MRHGANTHIVRDDSLLSETKGRPEDPLEAVDRCVEQTNVWKWPRLEILAASNRERDESGIPFGLNRIH